MSLPRRFPILLILLLALFARPCFAYIDLAPTIAKVIDDAKSISIIELTNFDRQARTAVFKELKTLKGERGTSPLVHQVASSETAIIPRAIIQWAQPGAHAVVFSTSKTAVVCIGPAWYQLKHFDTAWILGADRPELALTYYGSVARLESALRKIIAGGDGILTILPHLVNENVSFDFSLNRLAYPVLIRFERVRANLRMPGTVWRVSNNPDYVIGMGPVDEEDLPSLISQLQSDDPEARAAAADDIRQLTDIAGAAKASPAIVPLEKCLNDTTPRVWCAAAGTLLRITHNHDGALKLLQNGLASTNPIIRRDAAVASAVTGKAGAPLVPLLAKLLSDPDDSIRYAALQSLGTLGPIALPARKAIISLLNSNDTMIDAADALGRMGPRAQPIPPQLAAMLTSDQLSVRLAALRGMAQIGGKEALPAVDYIVREISTATEVDAYNMVEYLALLGPIASEPALKIKSIPIPNFPVIAAANWAMNAPNAFPWEGGSAENIGDLGGSVYAALVVELGERIKPCALALASKLMDNTAGNVPDWGYKILNAAPEESLATIAPHLADPDKVHRERAAVILARMGPPAAPARARLQAAIAVATDPREKNLLTWSLREITKDEPVR
jgi:hypothetical protein